MNSTQKNNLEQGIETLRLLGFEDNLAQHDQSIIEDMKKNKLHPFTVLVVKNGFGEVVFTDYLYMSEEDDLTVEGFLRFLENIKRGEIYSNCVSNFNYGEGELGLIGIGLRNNKWVRAW